MSDWQDGGVRVLVGKAEERLRELADDSVDAMVTDPPAGIAFMGRTWDHDHGGRDRWVEAMAVVFAECLRVLKPGAHGLAWAIPRTSHWTATAIEDAGFEVRDIVHHHFGSGFPKSLDVSKAIDRSANAEREVVSPGRYAGRESAADLGMMNDDTWRGGAARVATAPATDAARQWEGWGTALKPATEHWILVRKPLDRPNVAANVLEHGTGGLNIDGCRIYTAGSEAREYTVTRLKPGATLNATAGNWRPEEGGVEYRGETKAGRWPANLVFSHAEGCVPVGTRRVPGNGRARKAPAGAPKFPGAYADLAEHVDRAYGELGLEAVEAWECVEGCPVAKLDRQSGVRTSGFMAAGTEREGLGYQGRLGSRVRNDTIGDTGGASRFFYVAKASARERSAGLPSGQRNQHPTVKPLDLMRYLCRLVTPPGGTVLDPFAGSGTTLAAAQLEGFGAIGIEQDEESVRTAVARLKHWRHQPALGLVDEPAPVVPPAGPVCVRCGATGPGLREYLSGFYCATGCPDALTAEVR